MNVAILFTALLAADPPPTPPCRGVAIETSTGRANFVGMSVEGDNEALERFRAAAAAVGNAHVVGPSIGLLGRVRVAVSFRTARGSPSSSTNPNDATQLLQRAQQGDFGALRVHPLMASIDTLPPETC